MPSKSKSGVLGQRWTQWTEQDAAQVLDQLRSSGLSIAAFARQHGYSTARLHYWKARLAPQDSQPLRFLPVAAQLPSALHDDRLELRLPAGSLLFSSRIDPSVLAALVAALSNAGSAC